MDALQRVLGWIAAAFRYWIADVDKRQGCVGKGCSLSIGMFIIIMACGIPLNILSSAGRAVGVLPTLTPIPSATPTPSPTNTPSPTQTPNPTVTPSPTPTLEPAAQTAISIAVGQTAIAIAVDQTSVAAAEAQTATAAAIEEANFVAAIMQTASAQPTQTPDAASSLPTASVSHGGNLRSETIVATTTVIGQVCPGDQVAILARQQVGAALWYKVRLTGTAADCNPKRVAVGTEGWLNRSLISLQSAVIENVPDIPTLVPTEKPAVAPAPSTSYRIGAVCRDGTTSSATGRGACSRHGGVAYWLYGP